MAGMATFTGASSAKVTSKNWDNFPWNKAKALVTRLQMRIAKSVREGRKGKVKSLQRILTSSFYAKAIAVKRVASNQGAKTPGVDGIIWNTSLQKIQAANALKRRGYHPLPLRRIYIPKKGNKLVYSDNYNYRETTTIITSFLAKKYWINLHY